MLADGLVAWIRQQVTAAGRQGVVFGLSGGIDSAVVGALCQRASPSTSLGVCMPCYSDEKDVEHAHAVAIRLDIPLRTVPLNSAFDALQAALPPDMDCSDADKLCLGNLKARLRMSVLYFLGNHLNYLVVGSSNRSELALGYFTKYGDGAADIIPLANLVKSQVKALACDLGVPREIIDKPPSAGLWPGQTDEEEMGLTYEQIDRYLTTVEADEEVLRKIEAIARRNAHKKRMPAIPPF